MKHFTNLRRKSKLLLIALVALLSGASPAWAATLTENFNGASLPAGWSIVGDLTRNSDRARSGNGIWTSSKSDNANYLIIEAVEGSITFYARAYNKNSNAYVIVYKYTGSALGDQLYTTGNMKTNSTPSFASKTASLGDYKGQIAIALNYAAIDDLTYTQKEASASGPGFALKDGSTKLDSPYAYSFGLATAGTTKVFTLSNPGTEATPISVDVSGANGFTAAVEGNATSIPAGGEKTLTITMPDATASGSIVVTPTGAGLSAFTLNVSGTLRDPNKVYLDFSDGQIPDGWTSVQTGSYGSAWAASEGYISQSGSSSSYAWAFTSPKLNFEIGELIAFETAKYSSSDWYSPSVTVEYTTDATGATGWTAIGSAFTDDTYGNWTKRSVTIPVEGVKRIRFNGWYINMRNIYGGELPVEPKMVVTQPATLDFGLYEKNADPAPTKTFTIANTGLATLNGISVSSANDAFEITNAPTSLAAGASQTVTITMSTATTGALSSLITVSATDMEDATFTVTGTVKPAGMTVEDFEGGLPANWTNASWTFADGEATGKSGSAYLTTPKLVFSAGDFIIIKAKRYDSDSSDYLTVQGSNDNGSTWTAYSKKLQNADGLSFPDYGTMVLSDIPTTVNKLRFVGYYVVVDEIHGLTYAPVLSVTKDAAVVNTPANYDFGETTANASVTYNFANAGAGTINITNVAITGTGAAAYSTNWTESTAAPFDLVITRTYDAGRAGEPAMEATVTVTTSEGNFVINVTGSDLGANEPVLAVSTNAVNFGTLTANAVETITVTNSGTGSMDVTIISDCEDFEVSTSSLTGIGAGGSKTFDIIFKYGTPYGVKNGNVTVTPSYDALAVETITVTAKAKDPATWSEDFSGNTLPAGWEAGANWSFSDGVAKAAYAYGTSTYLTTPSLIVAGTEEELTFDYEATANYVTVKVQYSKDGADFVNYSGYPSSLNNGDAGTFTITGLEAGNYKFRFANDDYQLDNFEGFSLNANDPTIAVTDAMDAPVASGTMKDFGWAQAAQNATYKISNSGTGTLTISEINAPEGFTAATAGDVMTVAAGADPLVLTVTMTNAAIGAKSGTVTLTTDGGNFEIPVKGFVYGSKNLVDFTDAAQYTGWTGVNVTDNVASLSSTAIETTPFTADAAEKLYVEIKGSSSYGSKSFSYSYTCDGGANWSAPVDLVASTYSNVADQVFTITDIADAEAESTVQIRFTGAMLGINRIYGFTALTVPVMTLDKTADYNFGMQTEDAEYVITVTNTGTATLNNLTAALATGDDYAVAISLPAGETTTTISAGKATVPAGQQAVITVTQLFDANNGLAALSDVLTISGDDVASQVVNLSGQTRDGSKWYVDFASGIPSSFVEKGSWSYSSQQAYVYTESALVSQTLTIAANEKVQFDAKKMSYGVASLKVRHSLNGGLSWSDYTDFTETEDFNSSAYKTMQYSVGNTDASAVAMIEFLGANVYLDNIYGGTLNNDAPMIQVKKSSTVVASGVTEEFGSIFAEATANYTIKNIGGGTLTITSPITTVTGVATAAVDETSLEADESATLTITMPVEAPYGEKSGAVTVKTSLGDFVINYTATTMDPNALNVDFSDGLLPAGWYNGGWSVDYSEKNIQRSYSGSPVDFITQKLDVEGTSDVLNFDAKYYGSNSTNKSNAVLTVCYSTDRVNWTEIDDYKSELTEANKTFSISGLAAGEYYLKFTGRYVKVDNIIGWTKVAGIEHDLYVTATSFPATTDKGENATITATVTSLRANETGVYAKLFINGVQEGDASAAQDINLNATKTFSFEYAIPENKTAQIKVYFSDDTEAFATAVNTMKVRYTLDETADNSTITAGTFDVTLNRAFIAGWNTVCLPFAIDDIDAFFGTGAYAYAFDNYTDGNITFAKQDAMDAATPYLVFVPEAIASKELKNLVLSDAAAGSVGVENTFTGTYAPIAAGGLTNKFVLTPQARIQKAGSGATMNAFRAYFTIPSGEVKALVFDDGTATSVLKIDINGNEDVRDIFDLAGRKLNETRKGVNIVNGKKVLVK